MQTKKELLKSRIVKLKEDYDGWKNYPTWVIALWFDNDQGSQEQVLEMARSVKDEKYPRVALADQLKELVEEGNSLSGEASMYSDLLGYAIGVVDFMEIADNYLQQIKEE